MLTIYDRFGDTAVTFDGSWGAAALHVKDKEKTIIARLERELAQMAAQKAEAQRDAERYRATKWALIFHLDADDAGAAAEKLDADVDATVKKYLTLHTNAALAAERKESGNG